MEEEGRGRISFVGLAVQPMKSMALDPVVVLTSLLFVVVSAPRVGGGRVTGQDDRCRCSMMFLVNLIRRGETDYFRLSRLAASVW